MCLCLWCQQECPDVFAAAERNSGMMGWRQSCQTLEQASRKGFLVHCVRTRFCSSRGWTWYRKKRKSGDTKSIKWVREPI